MKLTHLLAGIVIVTGAAAGGIKGYAHYQVKSALDDLIGGARPFADIRYEDLDTDLSGSVTVQGLSVIPENFPDHFQIDAVTVSGPDLDFLLNGFSDAKKRGEPPEHAAVAVRGWHVRADGALIRALQESTQKLAGLLKLPSDSCSLGQLFGAKDFAAVGHEEMLIDMSFGYRFADTFPGIEVNWEFNTPGENARFSITLTDVPRGLRPAQNMPKLRDAQMNYRLDPAFTRQVIDYCAKLRGVERDNYIDQLIAEPDVMYQVYMGFVPGPGLRQAFEDLLRNPGELQVSARPYEPLDLSTLALYKPAQLPDLLGLNVTVNGAQVDDLSLSFVDLGTQMDADMRAEMERSEFWNGLGLAPDAPAVPESSPGVDTRGTVQPVYRDVEQAQLGEHIGRQVRIVGSGGRKRNGLLKSVERGIATVEERRYGGSLTSTIALKDIVKAEVFH
ncbi:MAG TPA: hypothetical protein VIR60_02720 [Gammaproteobacteria bacterium]